MQIMLFTSLTGILNRLQGKKVFAYTESSTIRQEIDDVTIMVDASEIEEIDEDGMVTIKAYA